MALTFDLEYYDGSAWTAKGASDGVGFYGGANGDPFDDTAAVPVGDYQENTHFRTTGGADGCTSNGNHVTNLKRGTTNSLVEIDGAAEVNVNTVTTQQCLRVHASDVSPFTVTAMSCFAYDGVTPATPPSGFTAMGFEQGDASFADIGGSANALDLSTSPSATDHYRYIGLSVSPTSSGTKTGQLRVSVTYQ